LSLQSGSRRWGFGEGTTMIEPFLAGGWMRRDFFLQGEIRWLRPVERIRGEPVHHALYNVSAIQRLDEAGTWMLGIEVGGVGSGIGLTPQVIHRLTKSGALTAAAGVRIPVRPTPPDAVDLTRWTGYVVWDYREPIRRPK
jgi:hypothetical protein